MISCEMSREAKGRDNNSTRSAIRRCKTLIRRLCREETPNAQSAITPEREREYIEPFSPSKLISRVNFGFFSPSHPGAETESATRIYTSLGQYQQKPPNTPYDTCSCSDFYLSRPTEFIGERANEGTTERDTLSTTPKREKRRNIKVSVVILFCCPSMAQ